MAGKASSLRVGVALALSALLAAPAPLSAQQRRQKLSNAPVFQNFERHDNAVWWKTDNRTGGKRTNDTGFRKENIEIAGGKMTLSLEDKPYRDRGRTGASYKSRDLYSYGRYDVIMKAARGPGVISAFYTYTGPVFGDPHDEIDFEIMGRNTRAVHLNYFVNGKPQLGVDAPLPFDAAAGFHLYTFEWRPGVIVWKADGEELFRVEKPVDEMPTHAGKIIADIWAAKGLDRWAGRLDPSKLPVRAQVRCMSFQPLGAITKTCADEIRSKARP